METMKAVVKYADKPGATELREVPVPEIGETDVLVEVAYVGVCGQILIYIIILCF